MPLQTRSASVESSGAPEDDALRGYPEIELAKTHDLLDH